MGLATFIKRPQTWISTQRNRLKIKSMTKFNSCYARTKWSRRGLAHLSWRKLWTRPMTSIKFRLNIFMIWMTRLHCERTFFELVLIWSQWRVFKPTSRFITAFIYYADLWRIPWICLCEKNLTLILEFLLKWGFRLARFWIRIKFIVVNTPTSISQSIETILMQKFWRLLFI